MRRAWTLEEDAILRREYGQMPTRDLAVLMGRSIMGIRGRAKKLDIKTGRWWTEAESAEFIRLYPDMDTAALAAHFGRSTDAIYNHAFLLKLHKSPEYKARVQARTNLNLSEKGKAHRIQPGNVPWNKGKKGWCGEGCEATQFKKGQVPHTWKPLGTERVCRDGYLERKITDLQGVKNYRSVHLIEWESVNGPLPPGHAVIFIDGNKRNFALDNLELVTRAELMRRNTRHRLPPELNAVIQLRGVLNRIINNKQREADEESHGRFA
jgi:hypothetical protein